MMCDAALSYVNYTLHSGQGVLCNREDYSGKVVFWAISVSLCLVLFACVQCAIVATRADLRTVAILLDISFSCDLSCILLVWGIALWNEDYMYEEIVAVVPCLPTVVLTLPISDSSQVSKGTSPEHGNDSIQGSQSP